MVDWGIWAIVSSRGFEYPRAWRPTDEAQGDVVAINECSSHSRENGIRITGESGIGNSADRAITQGHFQMGTMGVKKSHPIIDGTRSNGVVKREMSSGPLNFAGLHEHVGQLLDVDSFGAEAAANCAPEAVLAPILAAMEKGVKEDVDVVAILEVLLCILVGVKPLDVVMLFICIYPRQERGPPDVIKHQSRLGIMVEARKAHMTGEGSGHHG